MNNSVKICLIADIDAGEGDIGVKSREILDNLVVVYGSLWAVDVLSDWIALLEEVQSAASDALSVEFDRIRTAGSKGEVVHPAL